MSQYRNFIILGALFAICVAAGIHASHDDDAKLLDFSLKAADQILAAILTVTTVGAFGQRKTDQQNGVQK